MTPEEKKRITDVVDRMLESDVVQVGLERAIVNTTKPEDDCESFKPGDGLRLTIEIPPKEGEAFGADEVRPESKLRLT